MVQKLQENMIETVENMRLFLTKKKKKELYMKEVCARMVARNLSRKCRNVLLICSKTAGRTQNFLYSSD